MKLNQDIHRIPLKTRHLVVPLHPLHHLQIFNRWTVPTLEIPRSQTEDHQDVRLLIHPTTLDPRHHLLLLPPLAPKHPLIQPTLINIMRKKILFNLIFQMRVHCQSNAVSPTLFKLITSKVICLAFLCRIIL